MFSTSTGVITWAGASGLLTSITGAGGLLEKGVTSPLTALVPVGIGIMAVFIGISLVKRVVYTFL